MDSSRERHDTGHDSREKNPRVNDSRERRACGIRVHGRVQGVGFRSWAASCARAHGISGWVRNEADGSVELHAEGTMPDLDAFVEDLKAGNGFSRIDTLDVHPIQPEGSARFAVM